MSEKQIFTVLLEKHKNMEAHGIKIPFDVEQVFGAKRVPVKATVNGVEYRSTIMKMNGEYMMAVPKAFRESAGLKSGELITVTMEKDLEKRTVALPEDLMEALQKADLAETFAGLSYTHQKEYVNAVNEAKKAETRVRRIEKTCEIIAAKKK